MKKEQLEKIKKENKIDEAIRETFKIDDRILIATELRVLLCKENGEKIWEHNSHYDVITNAKIEDNKIKVKEMNREKYSINLKNGNLT